MFAELKREEFQKHYIDLWCDALSDLTPEWVEFGCRVYFRSMKFFPMPGDIREIVEEEQQHRRSLRSARRVSLAWEVKLMDSAIEESDRRYVFSSHVLRELKDQRRAAEEAEAQ